MKDAWTDWNIFVRDQCRCVYCGHDGTISFEAWCGLVVDHLVPKTKTSAHLRDAPNNKVVACVACNLAKGRFDPARKDYPAVPSEKWRRAMIDIAKEHLKKARGKLRDDYELMIGEIQTPPSSPLLHRASVPGSTI